MKRILVMIISVLFLSACQIQTVEHFEEQQQQTEKSVQRATVQAEVEEEAQEVVTQSEPAVLANEEETAVTSATAQLEKQPPVTEEVQSTTAQAPAKQQVGQQEQPTETTPATSQQSQPDAVVPNTKPNTPEKTTNTVTISIDAKTLLDAAHYDKLQRVLQSEQYVPKDGVILAPTQYEIVRDGETVFDILQRAVREFKIHMEVQGADENIYDSVYIEGIHHLYEFSAGNLSGWVYQVNGVAPNVGASQYEVKPGDVIRWRYTVDLGRDLDGVEL